MTTETMLTPSRVWKKMTLEQRQRAARAFWEDEEAANDQVQAALLIAQQKKFRPKTVVSLDVDRKARHLASLASLPDAIAGRALIVYHLAEQNTINDDRVGERERRRRLSSRACQAEARPIE
ncbi:MAG: hypothetical protein AUH43_18925 [Acidobacteria bacterium 13_1_40CM_65_14]|nr:MAG: hypothetical protein AUH43_18925 [Acidobacteria bacterium 13_1_40CM_65_14]